MTALTALLKFLLYGWFLTLLSLLASLWQVVLRWLRGHRLPERERKASEEDCVTVPRGTVHRPDPLIYSQTALLNAGLAVTWDNPDIQLFRAGVPVSSWELDPATEYEVRARVWNNSFDAPVVGLPVSFSVLSFGIGTKLEPVGTVSIPMLGVKGGPNHPAFASTSWTTPAAAGHYCVQVEIDPVDDRDPGNNLGAENTLVGRSRSPAQFTFELRNGTRERQTFRLEVDTYAIPPLRRCDEPVETARGPRRREGALLPEDSKLAVPAQHDRRNHPVPDGWTVDVSPERPVLRADEAIPVRVDITPPGGFAGRQAFNVNAFHDAGFAGGVTLYVDAS